MLLDKKELLNRYKNLKDLTVLYLSSNHFQEIEKKLLNELNKLTEIHLNDNQV